MSALDRLVGQTLDATLRERAELTPHRVAVLDRSRTWTWAALEQAVDSLAGHLRALGLRPGGILLAFPRRSWEIPVLFLATARAGGVFAALDDRAEPARVEALVRQGVDLAFVPPPHDERAHALGRLLGDPARVIRPGAATGHTRFEALLEDSPGPGPSTDPNRVCYLNLGSGTSTTPRALPTTHAAVQWNAAAVLEGLDFSADERFLCLFAPHSHPHEHWARALAAGATAVFVESWRPRSVLSAIEEFGVTWVFALPSVYRLLLAAGERPTSLRVCEVGGAPLPPGLVAELEQRLCDTAIPIWGATETTGVALAARGPERQLETLGTPLPSYEFRIDDADPATGIGELAVRGPAVVGRPGAWVRTGDLVRAEADSWRFLGRRDQMAVVGGHPLLLRELEEALAGQPGVRQAVAVSHRDDIHAILTLESGVSIDREQVLAYCRTHLPAPLVPSRLSVWDELPIAPSGQIDRAAVAARRTHPLALAVNTMLIAARPLDEAFGLAAALAQTHPGPVVLDLRSRRDAGSDPAGLWAVAHRNADFDLADPAEVDRAIHLSRAHGVPIASTSAYLGACNPEDRDYGFAVIDQAARLAEVAPDRTLLLRVLGGDLWARARSLPGRWQDIRRALRDEALATLLQWEAHARQRAADTGCRVVLGLEIHHGQYLSDLHDIHHACRGLADTGWEFVGFIEDPANRLIAAEGDLLGAVDFARMVRAWGGRILGYHLKDVRYVAPWSQFFPQPMQRVGEPVFVWGMHKYAWAPLGEGELDLEAVLVAAELYSAPPFPFCPVSAEVVSASRDVEEAAEILVSYSRLLTRGTLRAGG